MLVCLVLTVLPCSDHRWWWSSQQQSEISGRLLPEGHPEDSSMLLHILSLFLFTAAQFSTASTYGLRDPVAISSLEQSWAQLW